MERILSFKRSSFFEKGHNWRESLLAPVVSIWCAYAIVFVNAKYRFLCQGLFRPSAGSSWHKSSHWDRHSLQGIYSVDLTFRYGTQNLCIFLFTIQYFCPLLTVNKASQIFAADEIINCVASLTRFFLLVWYGSLYIIYVWRSPVIISKLNCTSFSLLLSHQLWILWIILVSKWSFVTYMDFS